MKTVVQYLYRISEGGAETLVRNYACSIDKNKFRTIILVHSFNPDSSNEKILKENNIEIIPLYDYRNPLDRLMNHFFKKKFIRDRLEKVIKDIQPDIIHIHCNALTEIESVAKTLNNTKLFFTCHSLPERYFGKCNSEEYHAAKFLVSNNHMTIIALHEEMRKQINDLFGIDSTIVIRNGVNNIALKNASVLRNEVRGDLDFSDDDFVVGHVGRFIFIKNQKFLIEVFEKLVNINPKCKLLLIGDGEDQSMIEEMINNKNLNDKVVILSHRSDVPSLLIAMDRFVFPSLFEGMPMTLIEAQIAGLRCVCSDTINIESKISSTTKFISLANPIDDWVYSIMDDAYCSEICIPECEYYADSVIKNVEELYEK